MDHKRPLAPTMIERGTLSNFRDMLRALETIENVEYRYIVHGKVVSEGTAALVKLMADPESATLIVNECLFLNVASFRYLDFERDDADKWRFVLHGDETTLDLIHVPDTAESDQGRPHLLSEEEVPDFGSLILLDDEDDEE